MPRAMLCLPLVLLAGGCGSETIHELPGAAEPARSPALHASPAGDVVGVGTAPEGVVVARGRVAVAVRNPARLVVLDAHTLSRQRIVPLPGAPRHLALDGDTVLVPGEDTDTLARVPIAGGDVVITPVGDHPHDATAAQGRIFVGNEHANTVSVIGAPAFGVATQPGGLTALEDQRSLAVVSVRERALELFDVASLQRTGRVPVGVGPTHVVSDGHALLYVADTAGDGIVVIHTRPRLEVTRRLALPGAPYGIAIDPVRNLIWASLTRTNELVKIRAGARPRILEHFPSVRQPDTVAVDPGTGDVYVTGRADGVLQRVEP